MEALKQIRLQKGWSQQDLADRAGIGQDTISGIESGRREPHPSTLRKLAIALGVQVAEFLPGTVLSKVDRALSPFPDELPAEERSRSIFADAINSAANRWADAVLSSNTDEGEISGIVYAALDLYELLRERITKEEFEALTASEQYEIMAITNKLAKAGADGLVRLRRSSRVSAQEGEARKQRREEGDT